MGSPTEGVPDLMLPDDLVLISVVLVEQISQCTGESIRGSSDLSPYVSPVEGVHLLFQRENDSSAMLARWDQHNLSY